MINTDVECYLISTVIPTEIDKISKDDFLSPLNGLYNCTIRRKKSVAHTFFL